jgi:hypothetical protein
MLTQNAPDNGFEESVKAEGNVTLAAALGADFNLETRRDLT